MKALLKTSTISLVFILGACENFWYDGFNNFPTNEVVDPPPQVQRAIDTAQEFFEEVHGPLAYFPADVVVWMDGQCIENTFSEPCCSGKCCTGQYYSWGERIFVIHTGAIYLSALTHELVHYWLDELTGDSDGSHSKKEWWGMVGEADNAIKEWEKCYIFSERVWPEGVCEGEGG